jgi:hypothetical protein
MGEMRIICRALRLENVKGRDHLKDLKGTGWMAVE